MARQRSEREFQNLHRRLGLALDASQIGVWEHELVLDEVVWDLQMHRLYATGRTARRVLASQWVDAIHPDDARQAQIDFEEAIERKGSYSSQFRIILPDGQIRHMRSRAHYYEEGDQGPTFIGAEWDVTADVMLNRELEHQKAVAEARAIALEASAEQIEYAAEHDYLTGLPNRRFFDKRFSALCSENVQQLAVLHVDLDHFKEINDTAGHGAGDAVLKSVATFLAASMPYPNFVARMGGDEFVILLSDFPSTDDLQAIADRAIRHLQLPIPFDGQMLRIGASIGIAWTASGETANLLAESDLALYRAKKLGRGRMAFFSQNLQDDALHDRRLAEEFKVGLARNEFVPFYQIQVSARTGDITGLEALARWRHPQKGLLPPGAFLPVAEELGATDQLDAAILAHVLSDRKTWIAEGRHVPRVAVNISARRLADPSLIDQLQQMRVEPGTLSFELLESVFLDDIDNAVGSNLKKLQEMGIDIEIDDFGSGHASIIAVIRIKPARLKIDRQLVIPATKSEEQRRLLASIIDIAKALNVDVVAEGIETSEHADILSRLGCDILQGYGIGYPSSAADTGKLLSLRPRKGAARKGSAIPSVSRQKPARTPVMR